MESCIFCKIIRNEIPSTKLYEDEHALAFLDIMPAAKGHALVIPKYHGKTLMDIPAEDLAHTIKAVQKVAHATMKATGAEGFNIIQSNNEVAGQVIPHVHFHIIPRMKNDNLSFAWVQGKQDADELQEYAKLVKTHL